MGCSDTRCHWLVAVLLVLLLPVLACQVRHDKQGDNRNLDIRTPVGNMHVSNDAEAKDIGLAVYPGARSKDDSNGTDHNANVNIATSLFGVKVAALEYHSDDSPEKVAGFYRQELGKYGITVECRGEDRKVHPPDGKSDLRCEKSSGGHIELKTGSEKHQRVVSIKPEGKGTQFSLVFVNARGEQGGI